ncbi:MAG: GNAT family N-acetyltransferase [Armatimonadetes bacterium]|nr:GNAT family N-acetyltransferase [Armatimonadota bacterium]
MEPQSAPRAVLRAAVESDVVDLAAVIVAAFADVAERFGLTPDNCPTNPAFCRPEWLRSEFERGHCFFVAEDQGRIVGCVGVEPSSPTVCFMERLAVVPGWRGRGVGQALVRRALAQAEAFGAAEVQLGMIAGHHELQAWYEQLGFRLRGTRVFDHLPFEVLFLSRPLTGVMR